ncbi:MAG: dual specificity protein phosphatase family protein [Crocinitomicaceae bacterium]|nr:dual specificity protein phosphatase family protein [Crocinitomicaceae bacterium]
MKLILICILTLLINTEQLPSIKNFHKVDDNLYRSAQPSKQGMKELESFGIKSILNVRNFIDDDFEIKQTNLKQIKVSMRAKTVSYENLKDAMIAIKYADKPILIHCLHGSDRTGATVAAYRVIFNDWSREKAIEEFLRPENGYNATFFPNILELLKTVDFNQLKRDIAKN